MDHSSKGYGLLQLGVLLAAVFFLAACGPSSQPSEGGGEVPKGEQPQATRGALEEPGQPGGKMSWASSVAGFFGNPNDPHTTASGAGRWFAEPVANGIIKRDLYDPQNTIVPELAEKWEVAKDGLAYTLKLKRGIKFHNVPPVNGREFTSEDAKYTLLRVTADPSIVPEKARPRFQRKGEFGSIKSIETPDKYTMVVNLKEPYAAFLDSVANPGTLVLPKEFVEKFEGGLITEGMIGTGPFIPADFTQSVSVSYKRNPDYWKKDSKGNQLPYLDEVTFIIFTDTQAELASFRSRNIDATTPTGSVTSSMIDSIKKGEPGVKVIVSPRSNFAVFRFNTKSKPFQDVRVRQAIHLALDRYQFRDLITEGRDVIQGPVTPFYNDVANTTEWLLSQPGYRKDKKQDMEEAQRLLKEAGYGDGLSFGLMLGTGGQNADVAALLADQLKPLNITLKAQLVDFGGQFIPRSINGEFDASHTGHAFTTDVESLLSTHLHSKGGRNYGKFSDPKLDNLIENQRVAINVEERRKLVQEAEKYILDTAPIAVFSATSFVMFVQPWVHNVTNGPEGNQSTTVEWAWLDKR